MVMLGIEYIVELLCVQWLPQDVRKDTSSIPLVHILPPSAAATTATTAGSNAAAVSSSLDPLMIPSSVLPSLSSPGGLPSPLGPLFSPSKHSSSFFGLASTSTNSAYAATSTNTTSASYGNNARISAHSTFDLSNSSSSSPSSGVAGMSTRTRDTRDKEDAQIAGADTNIETVVLSYLPQNPIIGRCFMAYGPPADVLRKVAVIKKRNTMEKAKAAKKAKLETQSRRRKWWIVLNNLRLYFYDAYGDARPKLVIDISETEMRWKQDLQYAQSTRVYLVHFGIHSWSLECNSEEEAIRLHFAMCEAKRCLECQGSMYMRLRDMLEGRERQLGYAHIVPGGN
jgi:hypothetical protein